MPKTIGLPNPQLMVAAGLSLVVLAGCSSMQTTPMMPTYPAKVGRGGVPVEVDDRCRQEAYQAAERAKQENVNKEVAFTAVGAIAGAVIGNQARVSGPPRPPAAPGGPPGRPRSHDLAGPGALAGAATGAALSQGATQDLQQVYDMYYNNCIARAQAYR